jgi:lysine-N-methylase
MTPVKFLQPRQFDAFRCIAADCEDTCCVGWIVHVDKATYEKFQSCSDAGFSPALHALVTINDYRSTDDDHARLTLNGATCPFLSEGLCSIQSGLGEDYLPKMCATYPRVLTRAGEVVHRALDLSCPEAARVVLLNPAPMEFYEADYDEGALRPGTLPTADISAIPGVPEPERLFEEIRRPVISLLQDRSRPTWKRLYRLGRFCQELDDAIAQHRPVDISRWQHSLLDEAPAEPPINPASQLEIVLELVVARITSDFTPPRFLACYREFMDGIQWTSQSSMDEIGRNYQAAYSRHYVPAMAAREFMLEHYLVMYAYKTMFPLGTPLTNQRASIPSGPSPLLVRYMLLIAYYAITRTMLIGMAGFHKTAFGDNQIVKLVQASTKTFEHSTTFPRTVINNLATRRMTTPESLCSLIRN